MCNIIQTEAGSTQNACFLNFPLNGGRVGREPCLLFDAKDTDLFIFIYGFKFFYVPSGKLLVSLMSSKKVSLHSSLIIECVGELALLLTILPWTQ